MFEWLYDSSSGVAKGLFTLVPWLFILYKHFIPEWLIHGRRKKKAPAVVVSNTSNSNSNSRPTRRKSMVVEMDHLQGPVRFATELWGYLHALVERVGFSSPIYFVLYHLKFSLFAAMYALYQTKKKHPDIFDRYRRRFGKKVDPQDLVKVLPYLDFAALAYAGAHKVEATLAAQGYMLLRHNLTVEPGKPAYFIAVNYSSKEILWSIRGTSAITDVITDIDFEPRFHKLESPLLQEAENPRDRNYALFHEGVLASAYQLEKEGRPLLENVFLRPLKGYSLSIVGHSLGGGVAACLGMLLLSKVQAFRNDHSRIHVYSFAPLPCVGYNAAVAHAPIITTVVNNLDLVARFSALNLVHFHRHLLHLESMCSDWTVFTVLFWWTKNNKAKLAKATGHTNVLDEMSSVLQEVDQDYGLYVPGKILFVWRLGRHSKKEEDDSLPGGGGGQQQHQQVDGRETDASHPSLRYIHLATSMGSDHGIVAHRNNIAQYIEEYSKSSRSSEEDDGTQYIEEYSKSSRSSEDDDGSAGAGLPIPPE
jgi:hypothetical protein